MSFHLVSYHFNCSTDMAGRSRSKCWCFTLNNPGEKRIVFDPHCMDYLVYSLEKGNENETEHLQGYVRWNTRKDMSATKNSLNAEGVHVEISKGTEQQNRDYCTKGDTHLAGPWEFGEFKPDANKQGARSDLAAAAKRITEGATAKEIALEYPSDFIRYYRGFEAYRTAVTDVPTIRDVQVLVLWGNTGTGKTHRVMSDENLNKEGLYAAPTAFAMHPFDGYSNEKTLFLDEWRWENWPIETMNKILDKWKYQLPCRYNNKWAGWTRVIIASNQDPTTWYPNEDPRLISALRRRLGSSCRRITTKEQDATSSPADPDFTTPDNEPTQLQTP